MSKETIKQAGEHVEGYIEQETIKALTDVDKRSHGEGCQCKNCIGTSVSEANSWLNMYDPDRRVPRFQHDGKKIRTSY